MATETDGRRVDGRLAAQLRPFTAEPAALARADGSCRFCHGSTEVLVAAYGPCEAKRARELTDRAVLDVIVRPLSGLPGPLEREAEQLLSQTLSHLVLTALHPRTAISIVVQILAEDGALLAAALHGACIALAHAGVPMRGLLGACTISLLPEGTALLDPSAEEERDAAATVTTAFLLRRRADGTLDRELLLSHMRGQVQSSGAIENLQDVAAEAAACADAFMRTALQRTVKPVLAQPERGARAKRVADLVAKLRDQAEAGQPQSSHDQ